MSPDSGRQCADACRSAIAAVAKRGPGAAAAPESAHRERVLRVALTAACLHIASLASSDVRPLTLETTQRSSSALVDAAFAAAAAPEASEGVHSALALAKWLQAELDEEARAQEVPDFEDAGSWGGEDGDDGGWGAGWTDGAEPADQTQQDQRAGDGAAAEDAGSGESCQRGTDTGGENGARAGRVGAVLELAARSGRAAAAGDAH
jgi:hypothetical protein